MTTIKDVAARAGVGIGTVSRVLNDHPAVTEATRARVRAAIDALDYHPNRMARGLSQQRSGSVAVVVPFFTHPSAVERLRGVLAGLAESPYEVVLFNLDHPAGRAARFASLLRRDLADGVLVLSLRPTPDEARRLLDRAIPTVVVDADPEGFPRIVVDDVAGGRLAAEHLLALGHTRIGYIGDTVDPRSGFTSSVRRLQGLAGALDGAGHPLSNSMVREGPHDRDVARELAIELLRQPDRPTAVFAHSDLQALGVLEAARHLGLRVPDELSVIGFDDIEAAQVARLTTVRQPLFDSGRLGAQRLLAVLDGSDTTPDRQELPLEIVTRGTTAAAPGHARRARHSRRSA